MAKINEITNQLMWNRLLSVVEEQGQTLVRTAFSPIVRECGDISAGIFDLKGRIWHKRNRYTRSRKFYGRISETFMRFFLSMIW